MREIYSMPEFGEGLHKFGSTGDAYDFTQCSEEIKDGDTLIVEREEVVGLSWTWPVAVTAKSGELHDIALTSSVEGLMVDAHWSEEQVARACREAQERGYTLNDQFLFWYRAHLDSQE